MNDNAPLWRLAGLTLGGARAPRLRGVTLDLHRGTTAVLGPSGSGKTSLLNCLVGFERPDSGGIDAGFGRDGFPLPLYWAPPSGGLWPHLTVREHLLVVRPPASRGGAPAPPGVGLRNSWSFTTRRRATREGRPSTAPPETDGIDGLLAEFDLDGVADARPPRLSQGERSRLAVARALLTGAEVLVMDEPLAHVDPARTGRFWEAIRRRVAASGASLVFATHAPEAALGQAERTVVLRDGSVAWAGPTDDLYRRPPTAGLAAALGPANWLEPEEARLWLGETADAAQCLRPEAVEIRPDPAGPATVTEARSAGAVAEAVLRHDAAGRERRFVHRPAGPGPRPGDRVRVARRLAAWVAAFAAAAAGTGCGQGGADPALAIREVRSWPLPSDGPRLPAPRSVAATPDGGTIALDTAGRVLRFDAAGVLVKTWWMPEYTVGRPEGVRVLKDGRIAVCDTHYHRVLFFDADGRETGRFGQHGTGPGEFIYPVGVAQDDAGNLYIAEYGSNDRVQKFAPDGTFLLAFGSFGTGPGQFQRPSGLAWRAGKVYTADAINNRILVHADDGRFLGILGGSLHSPDLRLPYDIAAAADGTLYVVEYGAGRVTRLDPDDGRVLGRWGAAGTGPQELRTPWGLAADNRLRLRIADTGNRRIIELIP